MSACAHVDGALCRRDLHLKWAVVGVSTKRKVEEDVDTALLSEERYDCVDC